MEYGIRRSMAHTIHDKSKLLARISRIQGQLGAVAREIEEESECSDILRTVAACRGALNGLMSELIEGHIRHHVVDPSKRPSREQVKAVTQLLGVVKSYLK